MIVKWVVALRKRGLAVRPGGLPAGHGLAACRGGSPAVPRPTASCRPLPLAAVAMPRCVPRWPRPPCRSAPRLPWRPRPPQPRPLGSRPGGRVVGWRPCPLASHSGASLALSPGGVRAPAHKPRSATVYSIHVRCMCTVVRVRPLPCNGQRLARSGGGWVPLPLVFLTTLVNPDACLSPFLSPGYSPSGTVVPGASAPARPCFLTW